MHRKLRHAVAVGAACIWYLATSLSAVSQATTPTWVPTGSLNTTRAGHTATLLPNGKVLVAGGNGGLDSAELYDPATATWSVTGRMQVGRRGHTATLLPNGLVLVVGDGDSVSDNAELYDPGTGAWRLIGSGAGYWSTHTATLLQTGKVLVAGGSGPSDRGAALYDPGTGTWSTTGSLLTGREVGHQATLLQDGRVLLTGGSNESSSNPVGTQVELYDPGAGTWSSTGPLNYARDEHTATRLPNGMVLVAGGRSNVAELFDPATGRWSAIGSLNAGRSGHTASLLPDGKVLVAGGYGAGRSYLKSAELYEAGGARWENTSDLNIARFGHTATLLPDGHVLVAGGFGIGGTLDSAELYAYQVTPLTTVVEYRNTQDFPGSPGGHFFYTDDPSEQALVDSGIAGQFVRTGRTFKAGGSKRLCRFYGSTAPGPNSHYYTISDQECEWLKALQNIPTPGNVQQWNYEGLSFAEVPPQPDVDGGFCAAGSGTVEVSRVYNNAYPAAGGPKNPWDSAHRYSVIRGDIQQMITQFGWRYEGVAFCSPQ